MSCLSGRVPILPAVAMLIVAAGLVLAGGGHSGRPSPASAQVPTPTATPTGFAPGIIDLDLAMARLQQTTDGRLSVAVYRPGQGQVFASNGAVPFPLASVAKVYILVAYLDMLAREQAPIEPELPDLSDMIEWSDNSTAQRLWNALGGSEGMRAYLESRGYAGLWPGPDDDAWGDAGQTAVQVAAFLGGLAEGQLLDPMATDVALSLLGGVADEQSWGVSAGVTEAGTGAAVMLKNGWYPTETGWRINSAGLVSPGPGREPYVLVILGDEFESFGEGVAAVERIAALINGVMLP